MAKTDLTFRIFGQDKTASKALRGVGSTAAATGKTVTRSFSKVGTAFAGIGTAAAVAGAAIAVKFGKDSVAAFVDAQSAQAKFDYSFAKTKNLKAYSGRITKLAESLALKTKYDDDATKSSAALLAKFDLTGRQLERVIPLAQDYASATGKDLPTASKILGKAFLGNTKALKDLGIAYKPTGDKAKDYAAVMELVNEKVGGFASKEGKTAAGQAAILRNQFGELQEKVGSALLPILMKLAPIGLKLVEWLSKAADGIAIFIDAFSGKSELNEFDGALKFVNNAGIVAREVFDKLAAFFRDTLVPAVGKVAAWFADTLWPILQDIGAWVMDTFVPAVQDLAAAFMRDVWPAIQEVAGMVAENLQPAIEALSEFWTNTLQPGLIKALPWFQKVAQWFGIVAGVIAVVVSWLIGKLVPAIAGVLTWIYNLGQKVADFVYNAKNRFLSIVEFVRGLPAKIASAASGMWNGITQSFKGAINAIISLWNNLSFSLPSVSVPGLGEVGGMTLDTPNIPMLAKGGIVTRPTLAMIGEAGPEAVVPLSRGRGMGTTVNIYVQGDTDPAGAARRIGKLLEDGIGNGTWAPKRIAVRRA